MNEKMFQFNLKDMEHTSNGIIGGFTLFIKCFKSLNGGVDSFSSMAHFFMSFSESN
jgi:hypothetical protein